MAGSTWSIILLCCVWSAQAFPYTGFSTASDDMSLLMANDGTSTYYFYSSQGGTANVVKYNTLDPSGATPVWTTSWNLDGSGTGTSQTYYDILVPHNMYVHNGELGMVAAAKLVSTENCEAQRLLAIKIRTSDGMITHESEASGVYGGSTQTLGYVSNSFCNGKIYNVYSVFASTGHHPSGIWAFDMDTAAWTTVGRNTTDTTGAKALFLTCGETGTGVEGTSIYLSAVSMRNPHTPAAQYGAYGWIDKYSSSMTWEWGREGREGLGIGPNMRLFYDANFKKADGTAMILAVGFKGWGPFEVNGCWPHCSTSCTGITSNMGFKALSTADGTTMWSAESGYPAMGTTTTWPISVCTSDFASMYCGNVYDTAFQVTFQPSGDPVIVFPNKGDFDGSGTNTWAGMMDIVVVSIDRETGSQVAVRQVGSSGDDFPLSVQLIGNEIYITALTLGAGYQTAAHVGAADIVVDKVVLADCPAGQYFTGNPPCSDCALGTYTDTLGALVCQACPAGTSSNSTRSGCDLCQPGFFSASAGSTTGCQACPVGSFSSSEGSTFCSECSAGTYSTEINSTSCTACPISMYQPLTGQSTCLDCPKASNTQSEGAGDIKLCQCAEDYFGNPTGTLDGFVEECQSCPRNSECARNQRWPYPAVGRFMTSAEPTTVYECSPKSACPGGATDTCSAGYEGEGCVSCSSGYTREFGECRSCPSEPAVWQLVVGCSLAGVVLFMAGMGLFCFSMWNSLVSVFCQQFHDNVMRMKKVVADLTRTVFKYGIRYIQVMSIALSLDVPWPKPVDGLSVTVDWMNSFLVISNFVKVDCVPEIDVESVSMLKLGLQVGLLFVLLCLIFGCGSCFWLMACLSPKCIRRFKLSLLTGILLQTFNVLYITIHTYSITVFSCYKQVEKNGEATYRLISDPEIECFVLDGSEWSYMLPAGLAFFLSVSCGLPLFFSLLIWLRTRKVFQRDAFFMGATLFLVDPYKEEHKFMEIASLAERFLVPMAAVFAPLGPVFQTFYLTIVVLGFILLHWKKNAFALFEEYVWIMQVNVSILITLIVAVSLARQPTSSEEDTSHEAAMLMTTLVYVSAGSIGMLTLYSAYAAVRDNFCKRQGVRVRPTPKVDRENSSGGGSEDIDIGGSNSVDDDGITTFKPRRSIRTSMGRKLAEEMALNAPQALSRSESSVSFSEGITEATGDSTTMEPSPPLPAGSSNAYELAPDRSPVTVHVHPKKRMVKRGSKLIPPIVAEAVSLKDILSTRRLSAGIKPIGHPPALPSPMSVRRSMGGTELVRPPPLSRPSPPDEEVL